MRPSGFVLPLQPQYHLLHHPQQLFLLAPHPPPRRILITPCSAYRKDWNPDPSKDTRIHWSSPDEGWICADSPLTPDGDASALSEGSRTSSVFDKILKGLVSQAHDSHYEFLGVPLDADIEQIKTAYRKLSKLYHPDTTSLPLDQAAPKFLRLTQAYNILGSREERKLYDWSLAQEVSRQQESFEVGNTQKVSGKSKPATVNAASGPYMEFTGQMLTALFFDAFVFVVSFFTIIYVAFFKH